jgi:hypothetical protein
MPPEISRQSTQIFDEPLATPGSPLFRATDWGQRLIQIRTLSFSATRRQGGIAEGPRERLLFELLFVANGSSKIGLGQKKIPPCVKAGLPRRRLSDVIFVPFFDQRLIQIRTLSHFQLQYNDKAGLPKGAGRGIFSVVFFDQRLIQIRTSSFSQSLP